MHAAYHRGSATSAASSLRDSVPATLPQLLRCKCLHAPAAPRPAPCRTPTTRYSPARNRPSPHAASSTHSRRSQAIAHSAAARRCTQRTTEVQRRQLRHLSEARCQRRCPIISEVIVCTHRCPSARPSPEPPPARPLQPRAQPPQPKTRSIIHAQPAFASTRSQRSCP
jgi:hypothetical protein